MDNRKYLLIIVLLLAINTAKAQTFAEVDSLSNAQSLAGNWEQLLATGKQAISKGIDYPGLRQRLGYAHLVTGDYSAALRDYNVVLKSDSYNPIARYYAYLSSRYLYQESGASVHASYLDSATLKAENLSAFGLISIGLENSFKIPQNVYRGQANYTRVSLSNRLGWRLQLQQSAAYYKQLLNNNLQGPKGNNDENTQAEYYGKVNYALKSNLVLMGGYHYLYTRFVNNTYNSHIAFVGLRYNGSYFSLQGDAVFGSLIGTTLVQYSAGATAYPFGNLDLYASAKASYSDQGTGGQFIFSPALGFKITKNLWTESSANIGTLDNFIDADGLYIYNAIDVTKVKAGQSLFYQLGKHAQLQLNYTYEQKTDFTHNYIYNQNSITAGILWKF